MADADPGLQSAELTSAQDRERQRVNMEVGAGRADRTVSTGGGNSVRPREGQRDVTFVLLLS